MNLPIALRTGVPLLERLHRRIIDRGTRRPPWAALDPDALGDAARERAVAAWSTRMNTEYLSMTLFAELAARSAELGHPLEITVGLSRLVQDEARHSELCARICGALGGPDHPELPVAELSMATPPRIEPRLAFTRWVLGMFSVGEATSVSLLRAMSRRGARDAGNPCVDAVLHTLHEDEVLHDAFGWALARVLVPTHTEDERDWLASELAQALAFYEHLHAGAFLVEGSAALPARSRGRRDATVGVLTPVEHARVFYERVERVILPRLDEMGIGAWEAWALRREVPVTIRPV